MNLPQWLVPPKPKFTGKLREISQEEQERRAQAEFKARLKARERADKLAKKLEAKKAPRVKMTKQQKALAECARLGETMAERRHRLQTEWYARNVERRRARALEYYHRTKKLKNAQSGQG